MAVLESREVADAKSDYLAARLSNDLQQDLMARDKSLWEGRAVPEQQYIRSRNAAAQTAMRFGIARQKLLALGDDGSVGGSIGDLTPLPRPNLWLRYGMVRPCSCPASDKLARGAKTRSTPCPRHPIPQSP